MRRLALALFAASGALGQAACSAEVLEIDVPVDADTQSLLLGVVTDHRRTLTAIDLSAPAPPLPAIERFAAEARLYALLYDAPLSSLGLTPRTYEHDPAGAPPPAPRAAYARTDTPEALGAWAPIDALPADLEIRLGEIDPLAHCPRLTYEVFDTSIRFRVLAAVVDEDGVFGISLDGRALRVDEDGVREVAGAWPEWVLGATRTATGAVWLSDSAGRLFVGSPDEGFREHSTRPHGGIRYLATPADPSSPFELFALSRTGVLERRSGGRWQTIPLGGEQDGSDRLGDLLWLGPGSVAAVAPQSNVLSLVEDGAVEQTLVNYLQHGDLSSLAQLDGALYASTGLGNLLRFEDGAYQTVASFPQLEATYDILPSAGGILLPGTFMDLRAYLPGAPECPGEGPTRLVHTVWTTVRWGDRVVAFTAAEPNWDGMTPIKVVVIETAD